MSAPDLLKALELCRPHIEALSVSDDDPAIKRLLKYVDAALTYSSVDAVPVGWRYKIIFGTPDDWTYQEDKPGFQTPNFWKIEPLYAHPVPAKPDDYARGLSDGLRQAAEICEATVEYQHGDTEIRAEASARAITAAIPK